MASTRQDSDTRYIELKSSCGSPSAVVELVASCSRRGARGAEVSGRVRREPRERAAESSVENPRGGAQPNARPSRRGGPRSQDRGRGRGGAGERRPVALKADNQSSMHETKALCTDTLRHTCNQHAMQPCNHRASKPARPP